MECRIWIKIFYIVIIKFENLDLKLNTYCICELQRNLVGLMIINNHNLQNINKMTIGYNIMYSL